MRTASLDLFTLFHGSLWRSVRYVAFFAFLMLLGMAVKSVLNWTNSFEVALLAAAVWTALLLSGPVEAWSQRSLRRSRFFSRQTLLAGFFSALWAAAISTAMGTLLFRIDSSLVALAAGSGLIGLVLATIPYTTGGGIR
jgi:hypothetical protein